MEESVQHEDLVVVNRKKEKRQTWSKPWDFYMSTVGLSVGLGNIWRFPYMCFKYGGGAFLIPYLLSFIVLVFPLQLLEVSLGQSVSKGLVASWAIIPLFKGIAIASSVIVFLSNFSYPVILTWVFKYFVSSFSSNLPWMSCDNEWNTEHCVSLLGRVKQIINDTNNASMMTVSNVTNQTDQTLRISSAEEFWNFEVLGVSKGLHEIGSLKRDLALYWTLIWTLGYFATFKGIKWSAKVVYVTATLPVIFIIIVMIRGVTLEGASLGIYYYLKPNMTQLENPEVWTAAATQVFYSSVVCSGVTITLGSYNKYNQNFIRDVTMISISNSFASFLCGFAVFSTLGSMAFHQNLTITEVARSGPGLVFIAYPQALAMLPLPQLWNVLFFLTILLLGFDSQFVFVESFCAIFMDIYPRLRNFHKYSREIFLAVCNVGFCSLGMVFMTEGGVYVFEIFNTYGIAGWCVFFIATCEFIAVGWVYGADRHWDEINRMVGYSRIRFVVTLVWKYIGPAICMMVSVYCVTAHSPLSYGSYVYPPWAQAICHLMATSSAICIPLYAIYLVVSSKKPWSQLRRKVNAEETKRESVISEKEEML
ncbi:sodium- and chloride-dependent betaine transporter-like isoform X2 [Clavelina lepadiformis]|uniref:sodium- and chloride-dependent betaine transporter-like isoform X2 n=1 Tax=Clavelina lepadiformis TaxID=159417 RepID=UPI0040418FBA